MAESKPKTCTKCGAELADDDKAKEHDASFHPKTSQGAPEQSPQPQATAEAQAESPASTEGAPRRRKR